MYTFKQNLVSKDKYAIKCPYSMIPKYITIHDTGNSAPAVNEIKYMISNNHQVSFHLAVDETQVIQGLPLNRNSWSCGDGVKGMGNRNSISVEICHPTYVDKSLYRKAEENAVYVVARLLYAYNLSIDHLKKHQDWSGKRCPNVLIKEGRWNEFKQRVESVLKAIHNGECSSDLSSGITTVNSSNGNQVNSTQSFLVKIICDELNIRQKADFNSKIVGTVKRGDVYTIIKEENGLGKLKSGVGYISMNEKYVKRK